MTKMTQRCLMSNTGESQHGRQYLMLPGTTPVILLYFCVVGSLIRSHAACAWLFICVKRTGAAWISLFAALVTLLSCGTKKLSDINKIRRLLVVTSPKKVIQ